MRVRLAYGRHGLDVEFPADLHVDVLEKSPVEPLADPAAQLQARLLQPIAAPPLRELARGRRDAVIVVSDRTRPVPNSLILPPILEELAAAGLSRDSVFVQVATGLHRPLARAELDEVLGPVLARALEVVQHDARSAGAHRDLGRTRGGIPILIDRFFLQRDLRIVTGLIEPHLMAGYSGGPKAVCPGLAAVETIRAAHGPALLEGRVGPGIVDGNPLREALIEIVRRIGVDFLVNVALDGERRVAGVFCGDLEAAHAEGIRFVESEATVALDREADFVVVSGGGDPLDATFYQAIKGVSAAAGIVRPGGVILLCASLSEGIGSASFEKLIRECPSAEAFETRLADAGFFAIDQWMVQALCQAMRRARVLLYSDGLPLHADRELFVEAVGSPAAGIERALSLLPPNPRCAVLPQGPYVLATVRGKRRPLGGSAALDPSVCAPSH
jgi:nickel-dependent lactate racemase